MADLNPLGAIRDVSSSPQNAIGVHLIAGRVSGGGTATVTVETLMKMVMNAIVINETDGAVVATTIGDSTVNSGTKKVSFSVANAKNYSYVIIGNMLRVPTVDTISTDTTITYKPISGN